jgi:hypothetical protein
MSTSVDDKSPYRTSFWRSTPERRLAAVAHGWGGLSWFRLLLGRRTLFRGVCQFEQSPGCFLLHSVTMKMKDMSPELFNSVPCPTCRVGPGKRCTLHAGGLRVEPHVDRKLAAMEAAELKRVHLVEGGSYGS